MPSLPTPLFQIAIQSAEAQTSTLAKLAPPHTAAHKLSHQLSSGHFNTDPACQTGVLVRRLQLTASALCKSSNVPN
jgi:hypothetical protein